MHDLAEARPPDSQLCPALDHQGVAVARTDVRTRQHLAGPDHVDHLLVVVTVVRLDK